MKKLILVAIALAAVAMSPLAGAQVNPAFSDLTEATEQARTLVQTERKMVLSQALELSAAESNAFWPVYDKYMADMKKVGDLRVKVITDYAANYDDLTDKVAEQLIKDSLKLQEDTVKVRKSYLSKFRKTLPATKLARFYQVENKMDAIVNFALARQIPLVPQAGTGQSIAPPQ